MALDLGIRANILEGSSIAVVRVDTSELTTIDGSNTLDVHVTLALAGALSYKLATIPIA